MSIENSPSQADINFECVTPILRVRSLAASLAYYTGKLGFKIDWQSQTTMASVSRGRAPIMLCEGDQGNPGTWVWIGVGDAEALFRELSEKGAKIVLPPTNYPWALEIHVEDPDGHVLRFGSEPLSDRPFVNWVPWYEDQHAVPDREGNSITSG
jgi:catechol 2,3-dioxygenase-like lactoylglutathione lyase family enzyme